MFGIDWGNRATVKLKFSGLGNSGEENKSRREEMVERAKEKTAEELAILEKLEKVRGLAQIIKAIGDSVSEVSNVLPIY